MRYLDFNIRGQTIEKEASCNFEDIVRGSANYLVARFKFTSEWNGARKVIVFVSNSKEYPMLLKSNQCVIPEEVLVNKYVKFYIVGAKDKMKITTEKMLFAQN